MNDFKKMKKLEDDRANHKRYCKHCGHSIVFPKTSKTPKTICSHCGHYIFKNDKIEFLEKLKTAENKIKYD